MMRKFLSFAFLGSLAKHIAGERPLSNTERYHLLGLIYSASILYFWYRYRYQDACQKFEDYFNNGTTADARLRRNLALSDMENMALREVLAANNIPLPKSMKEMDAIDTTHDHIALSEDYIKRIRSDIRSDLGLPPLTEESAYTRWIKR